MADRYWVGGSGTWDATATINWSTSSGGSSGASAPTSADNVFFDAASNATAYTVTMATGAVCSNLTIAGPASGNVTWAGSSVLNIYGDMTLPATGLTRTYTGQMIFRGLAATPPATLTTNGVSMANNILFNTAGKTWSLGSALTNSLSSSITLVAGTFDLNTYSCSTGTFSSTGTTARTFAFGSATFSLTGTGTVWTTLTATNFAVTGTPRARVTTTGATAVTINAGNGAPHTEASSVSFDFIAGTYALTLTTNSQVRSLNFTGFAGSVVGNSVLTLYGGLTTSTGMTLGAGASVWTFAATSGPFDITPNGRTYNFPITFNGAGGSWGLQGALTLGATRALSITQGSFTTNSYAVSAGSLISTGTLTRAYTLGTSTVTLNNSGNVLTLGAAGNWPSATISAASSTINFTSAAAKTTTLGDKTWGTINQGGAGSLSFNASSPTVGDLTNTVQPATVRFTSGSTYTFLNFSLSGTIGNLVTIGSVTAGSQHTLSKSSGTVSVNYCTISDSAAIGGATWNAFLTNGNVDGGNNTGWIFIPTLNVTLFPPLVTNTNAFYAATITAGPINLAPDLYSNTNLFYGATVTQTTPGQNLFPPLLSNTNAFYSAVISQTLPPTAEADIFVEIRSFTERRRF